MLLRKAEEGRAQSKTLRAARPLLKGAKRPGVRQSSGALPREPRCANVKMNWIKAPNSNINRICVLTTALTLALSLRLHPISARQAGERELP